MAPSAVFSKLRNNRRGSYSSSIHASDLTPISAPQTAVQEHRRDGSSFTVENNTPSPHIRMPSFGESPTDETTLSRLTALPRFSDELQQCRPSSSTSEKLGIGASITPSSAASRAHNFVFSIQPPKRFTASFTPNDSPITSPNTGSVQFYGGRPNSRNVSTSSLGGAEDAVSHKSGTSRHGRGKFHLLNPMSLLARRRSSQSQLPKAEEASLSVSTLNVPNLPDDYDPRIRGKIVHDFSIPKARRLNSYNGVSSAETSPSLDSRPSTQSTRRASDVPPPIGGLGGRAFQSPVHSPLFKEHFNDDRYSLQPHSTGYLHTVATASTISTNDAPKLPAFAKSLPLDIFGEHEGDAPTPATTASNIRQPHQPVLQPSSKENSPSTPPVTSSSSHSSHGKQLSPPVDFLKPGEHLPKHMTSTSSRFSFQLSGMDSEAQERLLEEKHKQHVASKKTHADEAEEANSEEDQYADDDFEDYGDLEEKIPGVNADSDEEAEIAPLQSLNPYQLAPQSTAPDSKLYLTTGLQLQPGDCGPQMFGLADAGITPVPGPTSSALDFSPEVFEQSPWLGGLGITALEEMKHPQETDMLPSPEQAPEQQLDDDDMYFDDGNIESLDDVDAESFDEDIFDDETGKIHDIPAQNARNFDLAQQRIFARPNQPIILNNVTRAIPLDTQSQDEVISILTDDQALDVPEGTAEPLVDSDTLVLNGGNGLTEGNLAYQNALVSAANNAAAEGRFSRQLSTDQDSEDLNSKSQIDESQPGLISDDSRLSRQMENVVVEDDLEDFAFDDDLDDDPMIAEANAEVLENDDEGFYGQEFGFYARALGKGGSEMVNGGYFGPKGVEGVHRSHSAKANFQEPSLTPITERSEWSHRNSVASLHTLGLPQSAQAIPSPGIAQLLDLDSPTFDDEMSLQALMKLRRGAWGGSQTSLNSAGGSQAGSSPLAHLSVRDSLGSQPPVPYDFLNGNDVTPDMADSVALPLEGFGDDKSRQSSTATETQTTQHKKSSGIVPSMPVLGPEPRADAFSPAAQPAEKASKSHSRASSGAESVSYMKDPEGSGRWLLERRRTGDDGELELIEREYLAEGRI
jgi:hypothetical protein